MSCHPHTINDTKKDGNIKTIITHSFYPMTGMPDTVRTWIIPLTLMIFFFFLPLQCFIIGDDQGLGIQGAVYRYQITGNGISLIPVTYEIDYVTSGFYHGKTAMSVILWVAGTFVLVCSVLLSLILVNRIDPFTIQFIFVGVTSSCILYLGSLVFQYGVFFSGPAGTSLPVGILIMLLSAIFLYAYGDTFFKTNN